MRKIYAIFSFFFTVTNTIDVDETREGMRLSEAKLWVVIGVIAALVFIAVIQASCTIYRTMSHSTPNHKVNMLPFSNSFYSFLLKPVA